MLVLDKNGNLAEVEPDQHQADLATEMREYLTAKADKNGNISTESVSDWFIENKSRNEKLVDALFNRLDVIKRKPTKEQGQEEELEGVRDRIGQVQDAIQDDVSLITGLLVGGYSIVSLFGPPSHDPDSSGGKWKPTHLEFLRGDDAYIEKNGLYAFLVMDGKRRQRGEMLTPHIWDITR